MPKPSLWPWFSRLCFWECSFYRRSKNLINKMCDYKVLHQNENGYVLQCKKCNCIRVAFGTTALSLTPGQLDEFAEVIYEYNQAEHHAVSANHKIITIPTAASSIQLLYSRQDLSN